jgi:hypothetical protein
MTCNHVLGLIDAGPFADYPPAHFDAAWQHARQCPTCGRALKMATAFTADLAALPEPTPPSDVAAVVLARIAEIEHVDPAPIAGVSPKRLAPSRGPHWPMWPSLGGLAAGLVVVLLGYGTPVNIMPFSAGWMSPGLAGMPAAPTEVLVLAAGIGLYVAGLFIPLSGKQRSANG